MSVTPCSPFDGDRVQDMANDTTPFTSPCLCLLAPLTTWAVGNKQRNPTRCSRTELNHTSEYLYIYGVSIHAFAVSVFNSRQAYLWARIVQSFDAGLVFANNTDPSGTGPPRYALFRRKMRTN